MQHALPHEYHRYLDRAYLEGDLDGAIQSLTKAFENRTGETVPGLSPIGKDDESKVVKDWRDLLGPGGPEGETADDFLNPIYQMRDSVSLDAIIEEQGAKVVTDWRRLSVNIAPEGETAEEFLKPIYADRDANQDRDLF